MESSVSIYHRNDHLFRTADEICSFYKPRRLEICLPEGFPGKSPIHIVIAELSYHVCTRAMMYSPNDIAPEFSHTGRNISSGKKRARKGERLKAARHGQTKTFKRREGPLLLGNCSINRIAGYRRVFRPGGGFALLAIPATAEELASQNRPELN